MKNQIEADEPESTREEHRLLVPPEAAGLRLDLFLAAHLPISRQRAKQAIAEGWVRAAGRRVRKSQPVVAGEEIVASLEAPLQGPLPQPELPLTSMHEDPHLVVVEKPGGWPTHPLLPGEKGTLANAVVARWPETAEASMDPREGGVAHRLDIPTSGLVAVARNRKAWHSLRRQFSSRSVRKEYLALVAGTFPGPAEIDTPIGSDRGTPGRMFAVEDARLYERKGAREAHTIIEIERHYRDFTLVRCTITTGVMHQIRVHLAHLGYPVAGDELYGDAGSPAGIPRLFLHAALLSLDHPIGGERLTFESPLPPDLQAVLDSLE